MNWRSGGKNVRVDLKGIHAAHVTLADGTRKICWYAWRGGPRLRGEPGSPDFHASYNEAVALKVPTPEGYLQSLLDAYQRSQNFLQRRERTRADYVRQIKIIEAEFGDFPLKALAAKQTRGVFKDWRDRLALKSVRQADYAWTVLALVLAWAKDRGKIDANPCEKGGRLYDGTRVDYVWSIEDEEAFLKAAPAHLHRTAARRFAAPDLERLRRQVYPAEAVEDWKAGTDPDRQAFKDRAR
jgi:hypothetical protein